MPAKNRRFYRVFSWFVYIFRRKSDRIPNGGMSGIQMRIYRKAQEIRSKVKNN